MDKMSDNVKHALTVAIEAAIALAEASDREVRLTFDTVALVVTPGRSATEVMDDFEKGRQLMRYVPAIRDLLISFMNASHMRRAVRWGGDDLGFSDDKLPAGDATPEQIAEAIARLACESGAVTNGALWRFLIRQQPRRTEEVWDLRFLIEDGS